MCGGGFGDAAVGGGSGEDREEVLGDAFGGPAWKGSSTGLPEAVLRARTTSRRSRAAEEEAEPSRTGVALAVDEAAADLSAAALAVAEPFRGGVPCAAFDAFCAASATPASRDPAGDAPAGDAPPREPAPPPVDGLLAPPLQRPSVDGVLARLEGMAAALRVATAAFAWASVIVPLGRLLLLRSSGGDCGGVTDGTGGGGGMCSSGGDGGGVGDCNASFAFWPDLPALLGLPPLPGRLAGLSCAGL